MSSNYTPRDKIGPALGNHKFYMGPYSEYFNTVSETKQPKVNQFDT